MFKIIIQDQCGCFKKSDLENNLSFSSKDDAMIKLSKWKTLWIELL